MVSAALGPRLVAVPGTVVDPDPVPPVGIVARHRRTPPVALPDGLTEGLVDANTSPVLFWNRRSAGHGLVLADLGSQADSPQAVGDDYLRWVRRTTAWVRRRGTRVWGLETTRVRPDLDIDLHHVSAVHALPGALAALEAGAPLRSG